MDRKTSVENPLSSHPKRQRNDDITNSLKGKNYVSFPQFDVVSSISDHHFATNTFMALQMSKDWSKKIQQEWKILQNDLPETIFVRVYEERMDLLRAVIVGPAGTPYHDGLFFFDFQFTGNYPNEPPKTYYHSGGLRLNPNLYANGTVCLSLLNTWYGRGCEKWDPKSSTMLQILVSIQGLILNAKPYFNEPGFSWTSFTRWGKRASLAYNETAFLLSCKTMAYTIRTPPKHFEGFVADHFRNHGINILMACRAYSNGTLVGCAAGEGEHAAIKDDKGNSKDFTAKVKTSMDELLALFTARGVDCSGFLAQNDTKAARKPRSSQKTEAGDSSTSNSTTHENATGVDCKDRSCQDAKLGGESARPKEAKGGKLKRFGQYLMKLGKKVLPIDN